MSSDLISLPTGGGAVRALGETFAPDPHTGTGNMSIPIDLPPGRNGLQPTLTLSYSTGHGNGPFGLGWRLPVAGVFRKTSKRIPRYDGSDVFVLSGAEDLVPVTGAAGPGIQRYRPRVEKLFARIEHVTAGTDHWLVRTVDGLRSVYGTPRPDGAPDTWRDPAVVADPANPARILGWLLTSTVDSLGNVVRYTYGGDPDDPGQPQRYLTAIGYADYRDPTGQPRFLAQVRLRYEARPDRCTDRRGGFPVRTNLRCAAIETWTDPGTPGLVRSLELSYVQASGNGVSLLTRVRAVGHDGDATETLPPLEFAYSGWEPARRRYTPVRGDQLPDVSLGHPDVDLVDLFGDGLPAVLQLRAGTARYWRNRGGVLDPPRSLRAVPAGVALGVGGARIADLDGDGRPDLLVHNGYFPIGRDGGFDPRGFVGYQRAPAFRFDDPDARLIDLDGDGVVDLLRTGETPQVLLNRGRAGWLPQPVDTATGLARISLRDSRIRLADMTGDGLTDLVLVTDGQVRYWPNLGYGRFGPPVVMTGAPRFGDASRGAFDERRIFVGDVDGDGCADLVYVAPGSVTVWVNRSGESFAPPVPVRGTPVLHDLAAVRLIDVLGTGTAGILWTFDTARRGESPYTFLDLTGGVKPYLLSTVDNHAGGRTEIGYAPSTRYAMADAAAGRPWRTTLPVPVHVVSQTTTTDVFSGSTQTVVYRYHHGYWDGAEREFRGFGRVDQFDTRAFDPSGELPADQYSPPTETRTWFHQGPVGPEHGAWTELNLSAEYWPGDPGLLGPGSRAAIPASLTRRAQRDVTRALAGQMLRTELYGVDGSPNADRPYSVTEHCYDLVPVTESAGEPDAAWLARPVVAVHHSGSRTTRWERGTDPLTTVILTAGFDRYGRAGATLDVALPRGWNPRQPAPVADPPLATLTTVDYATRDDATSYRCDRVAATTRREVRTDGSLSLAQLRQAVLVDGSLPTRLLGLTRTSYDGDPHVGLPAGELGDHGLATATATLALTRGELARAGGPPVYFDALLPPALWGEYFADGELTQPAFTRPDRTVDFRWLGGPDPALCQPVFSVRWTGVLRPLSSDRYMLSAEGTGGVRVWLDGQLVLDAWAGPGQPVAVPLLAGGAYPVRVEYRSTGWDARVRLLWSCLNQEPEVIPADRLGPPGAEAPPGDGWPESLGPIGGDPPGDSDPLPPPEPPPGGPLWPPEYPAEFQTGASPGYVYQAGGDGVFEPGYYVVTSTRYDIHDTSAGRGLATVRRGTMGWDTTIGYDGYRLLPATVTDPGGLVRSATYDYRLFRASEVVDVNGNRTVVGFGPLGQVRWAAQLGPSGEAIGDTVEQPGTYYAYGYGVGEPLWAHTIRRVEHRWTIVDAENARRAAAGQPPLDEAGIAALFPADELTRYPERFVQSRVYRDGAGRELQARAQADATVVDQLGLSPDLTVPATSLVTRSDETVVVVSGRQAYDNKGRVVRAWAPGFGQGWAYDAVPGSTATTTYYDPRGAVVRTVHPDGSQDRTVHGIPTDLADPDTYQPTPWVTYAYDPNDEAGRTHPGSSGGWSGHWNTPTTTVVDALGRAVVVTSRLPGVEVTTRHRYDIEGRLLSVVDPAGRTASTARYDRLGRAWSTTVLDAGTTAAVFDAAGNVVESRDAKGALTLTRYDALNRPVRVWAADRLGQWPTLRQVTTYGDDALPRETAAAANLLGRPYRVYDDAGAVTYHRYALSGAPARQSRQWFSVATLLSQVPPPGGDWATAGYRTDWQPAAGQTLEQRATALLDPAVHETDCVYDALGRRTTVVCPVDATGVRKTVRATFGRSGALAGLTVDGTVHLRRILYNARGQRVVAEHGNGVLVRYAYDPVSLRLVRQHSQAANGAVRQDTGYRFDLVGNPVAVAERAPGSGVPGATPDALDRTFGYDALYRLISATGREHATPLPEWWSAGPRGTDVTATVRYTESYQYDVLGNLLVLGHQAGSGGWTRTFTPVAGGNRLDQGYAYDPAGNLVRESTSRHLGWDAGNRLVTFRVQPSGATEPSQFAQYRYDPSGNRVLKILRTQGGAVEVTAYHDSGLDALTLIAPGGATSRHDELRVTDGATPVAVLRIGDPLPGDQRPTLGYHLTDHLHSSVLVLDAAGAPVNREEYSPYGETTFGSYARKRYRYTGKERDEESGFACHGVRYYAPWLARWTSCDPAGHTDGATLYGYVRGNPVRLFDPDGRAGQEKEPEQLWFSQAPAYRQPVTAGATSRGINDADRANLTKAADMWGGPPGPIQAGHFTKPFFKIRGGETQVVYAQSRAANASQGASVERAQARADRAAGLFVRTADEGRDPAWTGKNPKHPPVQEAFKSDAFKNWRPATPPPSQSVPPAAAAPTPPKPPAGPPPQQLELPFEKGLPAPPPTVLPGALTRAGNMAAGVTRSVVPGVVEAEMGLLGAAVTAHSAGYVGVASALTTGAAAVPVVGAGLVTGAMVGNLAEEGAASLGASTEVAQGTGALAAALSGAGVGALVGSAAGGIGAVPGAIVGGLVGLGGYYVSKVW